MTPASFGVQSMWIDAGRVWSLLPGPQQAAIVTALADDEGVRIRVKVHARVAAALRSSGLVHPLDSPRGRRDLTLPGLMVRLHGLDVGMRKRSAR